MIIRIVIHKTIRITKPKRQLLPNTVNHNSPTLNPPFTGLTTIAQFNKPKPYYPSHNPTLC